MFRKILPALTHHLGWYSDRKVTSVGIASVKSCPKSGNCYDLFSGEL